MTIHAASDAVKSPRRTLRGDLGVFAMLCVLVAQVAWASPVRAAVAAGDAAAGAEMFEKEVRPLLEKHCTKCHGEKKQKGDLRLDFRAHALKGGESGPALVPGQSAQSLLWKRMVTDKEDERMPPEGDPLPADKVALFKAWIDGGAVWPQSAQDLEKSVDKRLQHWAFQPVNAALGAGGTIDDFIDSKLKAAGLARSAPADRRTLIRRLYLDGIGLPPSPEEVEAFVADPDPKAYEKLVERVLQSERFGEKWARHWLDVVRFAESHGFEMNRERPNAWPYRDYVIRAMNSDKPYDVFVKEQLAGDVLGEDAATGFLVGGAYDQVKSPDPVLTANQRADELHDMVSTVGATFLGLTVNCARCHDHKFDPISARDYYALTAMIQGVQHGERPMKTEESEANRKRAEALRPELAKVEAQMREFRPKAYLGKVMLIDDAALPSTAQRAGVTQIEQPVNGQPLVYSPGNGRGQAGDLGDFDRLPNLGGTFRAWKAKEGSGENVFSWDPRVRGRYRIWISWSAASDRSGEVRYVLDRDGDLTTKGDQQQIAVVDQRVMADGTKVPGGQVVWSGLRLAGEFELTSQSVLVLSGGPKGGMLTADVVAFEEVIDDAKAGAFPPLRSPVVHTANEELFEPVLAKQVRFTVVKAGNGEPCIDELEVFGPRQSGLNVAAAARGTTVTASGVFANGGNALHQIAHINDGLYGNSHSWIPSQRDGAWVQLEFSKPEEINRIVWSRDRGAKGAAPVFQDRLPESYRVEISMDGNEWQLVASSEDRLASAYRERLPVLATIGKVAAEKAQEIARLGELRTKMLAQIAEWKTAPVVYAGTFREPGPTHRNSRGDPMQPREQVSPGGLSGLGKALRLDANTPERERRVALAEWIVDPSNPLTARVIVNRLWHYHFGTGLVDTPSDFGINGGRPSHPELLDWLAQELVAHGWSLKHIHRLILQSATFQQGSEFRTDAFQVDSGSRLLWRFPPRRMDAEGLRDSMLAVSGQLNLKMGGPGFDLFEPNGNYVKVYVTRREYGPAEFRRMVYQTKPRVMLDDFFGAFDCPDAGQPAPKRNRSITPLQALNLLNSGFAHQMARSLAERVQREVGNEPKAQVQRAYALAFGRPVNEAELAEAQGLLRETDLVVLCRALLNANEFIRLN